MTTLATDGHPLFWLADEQDILQALNEARQMEVADPNPARKKQWSNYACELSLALKAFNEKRVTQETTMREIYDHKSGMTGDESDSVVVYSMDKPGEGNACHVYSVGVPNNDGHTTKEVAYVNFQRGPLQENAFNGCSNESLVAIVIDRLKGFQAGPYACRENALALTHLQESMHWLHARTRARVMRGVEGTSDK